MLSTYLSILFISWLVYCNIYQLNPFSAGVDFRCQVLTSKVVSCTNKRIVSGFEGEENMPKLNFSGNLPNTIRNNILKLPVIPTGAFSNIQDGVQDGRQNVNTTI